MEPKTELTFIAEFESGDGYPDWLQLGVIRGDLVAFFDHKGRFSVAPLTAVHPDPDYKRLRNMMEDHEDGINELVDKLIRTWEFINHQLSTPMLKTKAHFGTDI